MDRIRFASASPLAIFHGLVEATTRFQLWPSADWLNFPPADQVRHTAFDRGLPIHLLIAKLDGFDRRA